MTVSGVGGVLLTRLVLVLAVLGVVTVAAGAALLSVPAGLIVAGVELLSAAYVIRYLEARR